MLSFLTAECSLILTIHTEALLAQDLYSLAKTSYLAEDVCDLNLSIVNVKIPPQITDPISPNTEVV